jgi:transposase
MSHKPRFVAAVRNQVVARWRDTIDDLIPSDHVARRVWGFVERLDTSALFLRIRSVEGGPGRPASDPRVLLALWLYALSQGTTSARRIAQLTVEHRAYEWIRGGVPIDYHLLSDFRAHGADVLDEALTCMLVALKNTGVITLEEVAIDGLRTRANTASKSYMTPKQVQQLQTIVQASREQTDKTELEARQLSRKEAAQARRIREEAELLDAAHAQFTVVAGRRASSLRRKGARGLTPEALLEQNGWVAPADDNDGDDGEPDGDQLAMYAEEPEEGEGGGGAEPGVPPSEPASSTPPPSDRAAGSRSKTSADARNQVLRVSVTDPNVPILKMGDGGFRPAMNLQFVTETKLGLIVGCLVGNNGSDQPYLVPLLDDLERRYAARPKRALADGNYYSAENAASVAKNGGMLFSPPPKGRKSTDRYAPGKKDTKEVAAWRAKMATPESQEIYKRRAQFAELSNARLRNNDVWQLRIRTPSRQRGEALLHVLAVNMKILRYNAPDRGGG